MPTVELRFSALPEHVRTARLVAAAVARRAGVDDTLLDEVRLAVGEACSRAVGLHETARIAGPVRVALCDDDKTFAIEVGDGVPVGTSAQTLGDPAARPEAADSGGDLGLAVLSGLVDDIEFGADEHGGLVRMSWPANPPAAPL